MNFENFEIINTLYKIGVYVLLPILSTTIVVGILSSFFQNILSIKDEAISYSLKVIALVILIYYLFPVAKEVFIEFAKEALQ